MLKILHNNLVWRKSLGLELWKYQKMLQQLALERLGYSSQGAQFGNLLKNPNNMQPDQPATNSGMPDYFSREVRKHLYESFRSHGTPANMQDQPPNTDTVDSPQPSTSQGFIDDNINDQPPLRLGGGFNNPDFSGDSHIPQTNASVNPLQTPNMTFNRSMNEETGKMNKGVEVVNWTENPAYQPPGFQLSDRQKQQFSAQSRGFPRTENIDPTFNNKNLTNNLINFNNDV